MTQSDEQKLYSYEQQVIQVKGQEHGTREVSWYQVQAVVAVGTGLAYHTALEDETIYQVTHIASGLAVPIQLQGEREARQLIHSLCHFFDLSGMTPQVSVSDQPGLWKLVALATQGMIAHLRGVKFLESSAPKGQLLEGEGNPGR